MKDEVRVVALSEANADQCFNVYNQTLVRDQLPESVLRQKTFGDPDFSESTFLAADISGQIVGFCWAVCRQTDDGLDAGIKAFGVLPPFQNQGIGSQLLLAAENALISAGATKVRVGFTRPNYITAGLDPWYSKAAAFLMRRGYIKGSEAFNMDVDLTSRDWNTADLEAKLASKGITCARFNESQQPELKQFFAEAGTSKGWQYQINSANQAKPSGLFVAVKDGRIIAFACYDGVRPGWFGPMATLESERGGGIGALTYLKCLQDMKQKGYSVCTVNAVGPLYFYSKNSDAAVTRVFWQFGKDLK